MDIDNIVQKVIHSYKVAKPLYHNYDYLYGNQTYLCPPDGKIYEILRRVFSIVHNTKPSLLEVIDKCADTATLADILDLLESVRESVPTENKEEFEIALKVIQAISLYRKV